MSNIIEFKNISKKFGELEVLKNISFNVTKGEVISIIGPSGSGKSTLLRTMNLLERIDFGEIIFEGNRIDNLTSEKEINLHRSKVGMVFQHFYLFPHLTVLENLTLAPKKVLDSHIDKSKELALEYLNRVGLHHKKDEYPSRLSGGQQQRVAIARALTMNPDVMLFDEATSALDPELSYEVLMTMKDLALQKMTMLVVTHEMGFSKNVSDKTIFMDHGEILEMADSPTFFNSPKSSRAQEFLTKILDRN